MAHHHHLWMLFSMIIGEWERGGGRITFFHLLRLVGLDGWMVWWWWKFCSIDDDDDNVVRVRERGFSSCHAELNNLQVKYNWELQQQTKSSWHMTPKKLIKIRYEDNYLTTICICCCCCYCPMTDTCFCLFINQD